MKKYLNMAAKVARAREDDRTFFLGAVGIRQDGVIVTSRNEMVKLPTPNGHAEARLTRKLGKNATVFVARVLRNGEWRMARPCYWCCLAMLKVKVKKVVYTIGPGEYGVIDNLEEALKSKDKDEELRKFDYHFVKGCC